jgi:dCMP deaminase
MEQRVARSDEEKMIIGVAGLNGAGKSAVVDFLRERSFVAHSLSDVLRDELRREGVPESREAMIQVGRRLREQEGGDALAKRLLPRLKRDQNYVIDSIRHPAEVGVFRELGRRFRLVWVEADEGVRFARIQARGRGGDPRSLEDFRRLEGVELASSEPSGQQLLAVRALADDIVVNDGSLDELFAKVKEVVRKESHFERPGWDEYFMEIAHVVSLRSNCVKRKVAAVITLDKRIISTGYNGTPRGVRNCNEGGCPRCNELSPAGSDLGECVCSHGEENAITQAAYHGVSVKGATLYSTYCPCLLCTKMIINAGIAEVVFHAEYPMGEVSLALLREAGVKVSRMTQ